MSLRIVPADGHSSTFSHIGARSKGAPSAPGLHDTLRAGVGPSAFSALPSSSSAAAPQTTSAHPLEARLKAWEATQHQLRMETLRRTFGMAEPIRREMELKIARDGEWRPLALGGAQPGVHEDILKGRDATVDWDDVFTNETSLPVAGIHDEMERKLKI
ncbi:hypothetical protein RB595_006390 [Gaeumannomyces hyphopodioides]